jgi:hypothetical protein
MTDDQFYKEGMKACEIVAKSTRSWFPSELYEDVLSMSYEGLVRCKKHYTEERGSVYNFVYTAVRNHMSTWATTQNETKRKKKKRIPHALIGSIDDVQGECDGEMLSGYEALADGKYDEFERIEIQDMLEQLMSKINEPDLVEVFIMLANDFTIQEIQASGLYGKSLHARVARARDYMWEVHGQKIVSNDSDDWGKQRITLKRQKRQELIL